MSTLIVAFPKIEEAKAVRNLLVRKGYEVANSVYNGGTGYQSGRYLSDGIIICGYKLSDNMIYTELNEYNQKVLRCFLWHQETSGEIVRIMILSVLQCL